MRKRLSLTPAAPAILAFAALSALAFLAAACGAGGDASAEQWTALQEWSTYQGNAAHTGYVPVTLDPGVFAERFNILVGGGIELNPVIPSGELVFLSEKGWFEPQKLYSVRVLSGTKVWEHDFGPINSLDPPAYFDGKVYMGTSGHEDTFLYIFDARTGEMRARTSFRNQWSLYYSPVIDGGVVYMGGGYNGGMYAFSAGDGQQLWFVELNQYDLWTPAVDSLYAYAYTGEYDPKVSVINRENGAVVYEIPDANFVWDGWSMNQAPVLGSQTNLLAVNGGRLISFDLARRAVGWEIPESFKGQLTLAEGVIYVVNGGRVDARDEADGRFLWSWTPPASSPQLTIQKPLLATKNLLFVGCESEYIWGERAVGKTYAVDLKTHVTQWTYDWAGHMAIGKRGNLFISTRDGQLVAIRVK